MEERVIKAIGRRKLFLSLLAIGGIFFAEVLAFIVILLCNVSSESLWATILIESFGSVAAVIAFVAIGGGLWSRFTGDDVVYALRYGWWFIVVAVAMMTFDLSEILVNRSKEIADGWQLLMLETVLLCLFIGIFEEFVFRGILFNGLLATMGSSHRGVMWAIAITSVLFGAAHVDASSDFSSVLRATQAILKMIQTGMYSVFLCAVTLRTKRLGGASIFHALDDFLLVFPSTALQNEPLSTEYVLEGREGVETILLYLVVIALYVPPLVKSLLDLHHQQDVTLGAYMEGIACHEESGVVPVSPMIPVAPSVSTYAPDSVLPLEQEIVQPRSATPVFELAPYQQQEVYQPQSQSSLPHPAPYLQHEIPQPVSRPSQPQLFQSPQPQLYQPPQPQQPQPLSPQPQSYAGPAERDGRPPVPRGL